MKSGFIKDKIFIILIGVLAIVIAVRALIQKEYTHMGIWLVIALLNGITLIRDYRKYGKQ